MSNATHTKRLARMFAEATGRPYAAALAVVKDAFAAGTLPKRLDPTGMRAALKTLLAADQVGQPVAEEGPRPGEPTSLHALWLVHEGRVKGRGKTDMPLRMLKGHGGPDSETVAQWLVDLLPANPTVSLDLHLMERDGYLDADADGRIRLTALGRSALASLRPEVDYVGRAAEVERRPYVGEGADGARRSAEIDRSEADGYDYDDPRRSECLASAERWEEQAERLDARARSEHRDQSYIEADFLNPDFLDACTVGTPESLRDLGEFLASAPLVETFWHSTGGPLQRVGRLVRRPKPALTGYGDLVLVDAEGDESEDSFDWFHDADKAARHRIHPDARGVTFCTPTGQPFRTHRYLFADEPLTSMSSVTTDAGGPLGDLKALLRQTVPGGGAVHARYADDSDQFPNGYLFIEDVSTNDPDAYADLPDEVLGQSVYELADSMLNEAFEQGALAFDPQSQKFYEVEF